MESDVLHFGRSKRKKILRSYSFSILLTMDCSTKQITAKMGAVEEFVVAYKTITTTRSTHLYSICIQGGSWEAPQRGVDVRHFRAARSET